MKKIIEFLKSLFSGKKEQKSYPGINHDIHNKVSGHYKDYPKSFTKEQINDAWAKTVAEYPLTSDEAFKPEPLSDEEKADNWDKSHFGSDYDLDVSKQVFPNGFNPPKINYKSYKQHLQERNAHPGELIAYIIADLGMNESQRKMGSQMQMSQSLLNKIIKGTRSVFPHTGSKLDKYFNQEEGTFYAMQQNYDDAKATNTCSG